MADPVTRLTVWYDGACPLCIREIALLRRLDWQRAIDFVDLTPYDALCPIDRQLMLDRFHAQAVGEPILSGAAAFAAMWRVVPLLKPLGLIARAPFVLNLLEKLYLRFLKVRPKLQSLFSA
jgi:predicted DCC family thiol-disulfide oxidoreductase YuxK